MNSFFKINTVLGEKSIEQNTITLPHEHICCYSEYLNRMSKNYLNKEKLTNTSIDILKDLKKKHGVKLFVDCTPLNIGRDIEMLKKISYASEVDIVASTGFYYNYEPILDCMSEKQLAKFIVEDAKSVGAGAIKAAIESKTLSPFNIKLLKVAAYAQKETNLPIILHTNANNKNGIKAVEILLAENIRANKITVGHLSDTEDSEYIKLIAKTGCYIALDRLYENKTEKYINSKVTQINNILSEGFGNRLLLSHDDSVFQGFCDNPQIKKPRWDYLFENIINKFDDKTKRLLLMSNPLSMLRKE